MTVPQPAPVQLGPDTLHVTAVFWLPVTVAVNCFWVPGGTDADVGEMLTLTCAWTVTNAAADFEGSATDFATTLKNGGFGGLMGAVYRPVESTLPQVLPAQPIPEMIHATAVFCVPDTVAVNCCCAPVATVACEGETATLIELPEVTVTVAEAATLGSAKRVAVTATAGGVGAVAGAV